MLNYLENGPQTLPHDSALLARLHEAAKCLCIVTLQACARFALFSQPRIFIQQDYTQYPLDQFQLSAEDLAMKMRVDTIRHLFGTERRWVFQLLGHSDTLQRPHIG